MRKIQWAAATVAAIIFFSSFRMETGAIVPYPEHYRQWTHVTSGVIGEGNPAFKRYGGLHHIYANSQAMEGYRTGNFPEGSMIVFDMLDVKTDNFAITGTSRKFIDVMLKDSQRFSETGGWGFEEFNGDSHETRNLTQQTSVQCYTCHAKRKNEGYIFTSFKE